MYLRSLKYDPAVHYTYIVVSRITLLYTYIVKKLRWKEPIGTIYFIMYTILAYFFMAIIIYEYNTSRYITYVQYFTLYIIYTPRVIAPSVGLLVTFRREYIYNVFYEVYIFGKPAFIVFIFSFVM